MLVDYSDSDEEEAAPAAPPAAAPAASSSAPPAKKARKEINLQSLLQKHDAPLPFEEAAHLPADFFDSARVREPDAGEAGAEAPAARGWAALSSILPAPKNQAKKGGSGKKDPGALFRNAKPIKRGETSASDAPSRQPATVSTSAPLPAADDDEPEPATVEQPPMPEPSHAAGPSLLPRMRVGMYDEPDPDDPDVLAAAAAASGGITYDLPAGPSVGPSEAVAEAAYGGDIGGAYGEMPHDVDESNVVDVSVDALRKAIGPARQYDFGIPKPKEEVKIAANFWSRTSGAVEATHKPSTLQKRKNQINSLAANAAARSSEIKASGSKGMKSKKETAAKYGW